MALLTLIAGILDSLARLWPALAKELQSARDRAVVSRAEILADRQDSNAADLARLRATVASERADNPSKGANAPEQP